MVDKTMLAEAPGTPITAPPAALLPRAAATLTPGRILQLIVLPAAILAIWEAIGQFELLPAGILPPPSRALAGWYVWAFGPAGFGLNPYSGTWFDNVRFSAERVAQGYALAILVGVPLGIMIGWSRVMARIVDPTIQSLRPIPI